MTTIEADPALWEVIRRLDKDLKQAARLLGKREVRTLTDLYYQVQEFRKRSANQVRATEAGDPSKLSEWVFDSMRVLEDDIVIYSPAVEEVARHLLLPRTVQGVRQDVKSHHPTDDPHQRERLLRQRFEQLGPVAVKFLEGLLAKQAQGKLQAQQLLALIVHYPRHDVHAALERAVGFGAFSLTSIQRILAAQARPKPLLDELAEREQEALDPRLRQDPVEPRPSSEYQPLLLPEDPADEASTGAAPPQDPPAQEATPDPDDDAA